MSISVLAIIHHIVHHLILSINQISCDLQHKHYTTPPVYKTFPKHYYEAIVATVIASDGSGSAVSSVNAMFTPLLHPMVGCLRMFPHPMTYVAANMNTQQSNGR